MKYAKQNLLQVHLIDFDDESNLVNKHIFMHSAGEIWLVSDVLKTLFE